MVDSGWRLERGKEVAMVEKGEKRSALCQPLPALLSPYPFSIPGLQSVIHLYIQFLSYSFWTAALNGPMTYDVIYR